MHDSREVDGMGKPESGLRRCDKCHCAFRIPQLMGSCAGHGMEFVELG